MIIHHTANFDRISLFEKKFIFAYYSGSNTMSKRGVIICFITIIFELLVILGKMVITRSSIHVSMLVFEQFRTWLILGIRANTNLGYRYWTVLRLRYLKFKIRFGFELRSETPLRWNLPNSNSFITSFNFHLDLSISVFGALSGQDFKTPRILDKA